jgi:acyl-coenzyme A synthetase/AMP-(fatty) acid ligase
MTTREIKILPRSASTYQLLDAAGAWPDGIATQWIPDPADHTRCLAWTYAELAAAVTRIANALTALGVRRQDAVTLSSVNSSMLYAATLAPQAVGIGRPAMSPAGRAAFAPAGRCHVEAVQADGSQTTEALMTSPVQMPSPRPASQADRHATQAHHQRRTPGRLVLRGGSVR